MSILKRLGLTPKRPRLKPVGNRLETGKEPHQANQSKLNWWGKATIFLGLILVTLLAFPHQQSYDWADAKVDDVWRRGDVIADFDFPIYRTEQQLATERKRILHELEPIFIPIDNPEGRYNENLDSLNTRLQRTVSAFLEWEFSRSRGLMDKAAIDSARYYRSKENLPIKVNERQWTYLLESSKSVTPGVTTTARIEPSAALKEVLFEQLASLKDLFDRPSIGLPRDSLHAENIIVRNNEAHLDRSISIKSVRTRDQVLKQIEQQFAAQFPQKQDTVAIGIALFDAVFQPSLIFEKEATHALWNAAIAQISYTQGVVKKDQAIIRQGEVVTPEVLAKLRSYSRSRSSGTGVIPNWRITIGELLLVFSIYSVFFLYLYLFRKPIFDRNLHVLLIALLFGAFVVAYGIVLRSGLDHAFKLVIPVTILSVMFTIVFDSRVGLFGTMTMSLVAGLLFAFDFQLTYLTAFAGMIAVFSVRDIRNRGQFVSTAGLVHFAYALGATSFALLQSNTVESYLYTMLYVAINAALTLFVYPIVWVIERVFDVTTDLTLLELSDTNRPLLKELSLRAPGTFNHSLQVSNLAEAAAVAIGANALLTRVGALYHDIGKMSKPEYFVENQQQGQNPLDALTPRMAALIIVNHVKEGLQLAQDARLPKVVQQFIPMHHGCMRIEFFYRKALEIQKEETATILESDYRYPGPRPNTLETAILMLADGVEAASKSLEKPTLKKLEGVIDKIIEARIGDGQLKDSPLTFHDLTKIKEAFMGILGGMYHFRLKYPGQEEELEPKTAEVKLRISEEIPTDQTIIPKETPARASAKKNPPLTEG
ncbi:MAG TPA: HDIG domain-containing protein [Rhodothermales bacterium]|nr:HDIG domain-containing protein [Rhodothermales bacterium]